MVLKKNSRTLRILNYNRNMKENLAFSQQGDEAARNTFIRYLSIKDGIAPKYLQMFSTAKLEAKFDECVSRNLSPDYFTDPDIVVRD